MTREAAEEFFALTGQTVDQRLADIAATAHAVLETLERNACPHKRAAINRWAFRALDLCSRTFCCPPPAELVALVEHQLGVAGEKRDGSRKNRASFIAAADHVARHLDATPAQIARAIGYDQKAVIRRWQDDPEFLEIVAIKRRRLDAQQEKDCEG